MKMPEGIVQIPGTTAHCYSLELDGKSYLIDAGMRSSARKIIQYFREVGKKPDSVLITHYHPDHIGGLSEIVRVFSPDVYAPDEEISVITGKARIKPAKSVLSRMIAGVSRIEPVEDVKPVSSLSVPGINVVPTHGHTPGSTSYFVEGTRAIFVGDAIVKKGSEISVNKAFTLNYNEALISKEKILSLKPALILPGHGNLISFDGS